ncbi:DNA-binding MarR family transcriptional regulator [Microbacterium halimionae]|uniref:DNA-binding MarR family transcriptional regulator n=1 Tax=Microbacterium halimionae TaxID=1526413 RepID=A0A7W3PKW6_9MICO|nr:MarR family transcriptional regulator [Microbacterium halimionae]MBA8815264.1 DNA-binding MarR family transcriptional regulator [Microbacterium halimionae]NII93945.1 DNA-binding MarR family transcriptional regulator [Microbacterium halimionae]
MTKELKSLSQAQLAAYFAFTEVGALLRPAVEKQLRDAGALSYVQFQLLARLGDTPEGHERMTDLADGIVYSRSGVTYQAQLLEQRGLITRYPSPDDERSTVVTITDAGRGILRAVFPGHIATVHGLLFSPLTEEDAEALARILGRVGEHLRAAPPRSAGRRRAK